MISTSAYLICISFCFCELRKNGDMDINDGFLKFREAWQCEQKRAELWQKMAGLAVAERPRIAHKGLTWAAAIACHFAARAE